MPDVVRTVLLVVGGFLVLWAEEDFATAWLEMRAFVREGGWRA